jgi:hypothetical protein
LPLGVILNTRPPAALIRRVTASRLGPRRQRSELDSENSSVLVRSIVTERQTEQTRRTMPAPTFWSALQRCFPMRQITAVPRLEASRPNSLRLTVRAYLIEW